MSSLSASSPGPIGMFDSGLGGLSVLRHVRAQLPLEDLLYFADSAYAPYGDRPETQIVARTLAIADFLVGLRAKALVVACNTATAAAITAVRARHPALPVVGVEPGLKPAAALSKSGIVGVLATERTVKSERFVWLQAQVEAATGARFLAQGCPGLADQVEKGELRSAATARLVRAYIAPLLEQGADTLVLGCTHYPFLRPLIEDICIGMQRQPIAIVDTGEPVARQLVRLLQTQGSLHAEGPGTLGAYTSGNAGTLAAALPRLLGITAEVQTVAVR